MKPNFYTLFTFFIISFCLFISAGTKVQGQIITTVAGDGSLQGNPNPGLGVADSGDGGLATKAFVKGPYGVVVDDSGNIYITEHFGFDIRKVSGATGVITKICGTNNSYGFSGDNGPATAAQTTYAAGITLDDSGNIYFCDLYASRVRKISKNTGIITTVAGSGGVSSGGSYTGNYGPATSATMQTPYGVAVTHNFDIYIADTYNNVIRKVDHTTGIITTVVGDAYGRGSQPSGRYTGDNGDALSASLTDPYGLAFDDSDKYMYIADTYNNAIRRVDMKTNIITTVAGTGYGAVTLTTGDSIGDGGPATSARLFHPIDVKVDHSGNIYISDQLNNVIRKVDHLTGIISVAAGNGYGAKTGGSVGGYTGDGGPATSAELWVTSQVAVDKCNNLYIVDFYNNLIRKVSLNPIQVSVNIPSAPICSGDSITLKAFGADNYTWSPSAGLSSTNDSVVIAKPTSTTTYHVTGTSGCSSATATSVITVNSASIPITISPVSPKVCSGQSVTLSVPAGASNVVWSPSTGLNKTTGDTVVVTTTSDQIYTATSGGACSSSGTDTVTILTTNQLSFSPANPQVCPGQQTAILVTGGSNLRWSPSTGLNKPTGDTVIAQLTGSATSEVYTVTGVDTSGCPVTDSVTLSAGGSAVGGHVSAVRDTICQGTPGNLSLSGNSSNTIQWQSSGDDNNFTDAVGDTLVKYKTKPLTQSTWYRATVGSGSCIGLSDTLQLIVPPPLTAYFNANQTVANQLTFDSDSSGGNIRSYHWDFGDGNTSAEKNPSHTYTKDTTYYVCLTLYDGSNCSYTFCRYSDVTDAVPTISANGNWIIYPNPFSEQLTVSSKQTNSHLESIELYDVLGQLVINKSFGNITNTSIQLDVSALAKGMYYVMIRTAEANYVQKVIKQ